MFSYTFYYMYTVVGTVGSLVVLLPHIIVYIYMPTMLPVVYKGFYTDVIFIRKINANLFLQVICVCKINHYLLHKTKYILSFVKLVVILLLSVYQTLTHLSKNKNVFFFFQLFQRSTSQSSFLES